MSSVVGVLALVGAFGVPEGRRWVGLEENRLVPAGSVPEKVSPAGKSNDQQLVGSSEMSTSTHMNVSSGEIMSAPTRAKRQSPPQARTPHDEITVSDECRGFPDVVAAADDALNVLRSQSYSVQGHLRSTQSEPNDQLQGLITTDLTLDVKLIGNQDVVFDTFTITGRGGGFTSTSSALLARERLRDMLQDHLRKEHP